MLQGFLLPLCAEGNCTLREAVIVSAVLRRVSLPMLHSAAALLRIADMEYSGTNSFFIQVLNKKYALPYRVVTSLRRSQNFEFSTCHNHAFGALVLALVEIRLDWSPVSKKICALVSCAPSLVSCPCFEEAPYSCNQKRACNISVITHPLQIFFVILLLKATPCWSIRQNVESGGHAEAPRVRHCCHPNQPPVNSQ